MTAEGRDQPSQSPARLGTHAVENALQRSLRACVLGSACAYPGPPAALRVCIHLAHRRRSCGAPCASSFPGFACA